MAKASDVTSKLLAQLPIVDEDILREAADNPLRFMRAARFYVAALRRRHEAESVLDGHRAMRSLRVRAKKNAAGEKATEGNLKEIVEADATTKSLRGQLERAWEVEAYSKLILEAYRMRRDAIEIIAKGQGWEAVREEGELERAAAHRALATKARALEDEHRRLHLENSGH